jgi:hypothetical protein
MERESRESELKAAEEGPPPIAQPRRTAGLTSPLLLGARADPPGFGPFSKQGCVAPAWAAVVRRLSTSR